jgi:hypothetical protein
MKIKAERIICYVNDGFSLFKVNDLMNRSYLIIDKLVLSSLLKDNENLNNEQLKRKVRDIINHDDKYQIYHRVKEILFEEKNL